MALPKVNEVLKFSLKIPSTGQTVKYRPYLVKEEKVLLQAFESKDMTACLQAMADTIEACLDDRDGINVSKLPTFDLEYMFIQIRGKSVGETSDIIIKCKSCEQTNPYSVDLDRIEVSESPPSNIVDITDSIKVELSFPSYQMIMDRETEDESHSVDHALDILSRSIIAVHTEEERIDIKSQPKEEVLDFINSMTASQVKKMSEYLEKMPSLSYTAKFNCSKCETENELILEGLSDFF